MCETLICQEEVPNQIGLNPFQVQTRERLKLIPSETLYELLPHTTGSSDRAMPELTLGSPLEMPLGHGGM